MEKTFNKVNYSEYEGKYDERIKEKMAKEPENIDVETMRANLYGYTFTKEYADGEIPDELSMDYWEEYSFENDLLEILSKLIWTRCSKRWNNHWLKRISVLILMCHLKRNCFLKP